MNKIKLCAMCFESMPLKHSILCDKCKEDE